MSADT